MVLERKVPFSFWKVFLPPLKEGAKRRLFIHCWPKRERGIEGWKDRESGSRIHERKILLRFLGIILRVLRLEVSVDNFYITNLFQATFAQGGREVGSKICW